MHIVRWIVLCGLAGAAIACERREPEPAPVPADTVVAEPTPADTTSAAPTPPASQLAAALRQLTRGAHEGALADGQSWFTEATADVVRSVDVDSSGHAIIDFVDLRPIIGNASSSAGSQILLHDLNGVVFSVRGIESVEYRMLGSCDLFGDWLQYGCLRVTRADYNRES